MNNLILITAAALLAATAADPCRDMTCDGPYRGSLAG